MKAIDKWLQPDLTEDQDDQLTEKFIARQVEETYRQTLRDTLEREYGVSKNSHSTRTSKTFRLTGWKAWVSAAAAIVICFIGLKLFLPADDPAGMAMHYIDEQTFFHAGTTKGIMNESQIREQIQSSFNEKRYDQAAGLFEQIVQPTEEDVYYQALAQMLGSNPEKAVPLFDVLTISDGPYTEAARWYKALSLMLTHQPQDALAALRTIKPNEWNYELAQKYIRNLD